MTVVVDVAAGATISTVSATGLETAGFAGAGFATAAATAAFGFNESLMASVTSLPPRRWPIFPEIQSCCQIQVLSTNTRFLSAWYTATPVL